MFRLCYNYFMDSVCKFKHPKGLYLLFFVEMWERFSFYGMRALLVLYMVQELLYSSQKAGTIYGIYTGLVYLTPLVGGYLADNVFGQRKCITAGALLMFLGLFLLAFGGETFLILSLLIMIAANGCFKSNISSVLGLLYSDNNDKKDSAYTIFYMGINLGAFLSPLVCGTLAFGYGFKIGFAAAGIGMLIGLITYMVFEDKMLGDIGVKPLPAEAKFEMGSGEPDNENSGKFASLIFLMLFTIPFWICFEQAGSSLTLFAEYQTNRVFFGHEIPTGYFQSLNPLFIIILAPLFSMLWEKLRAFSKEPSSVAKFAIALLLMTVACCILVFAGNEAANTKISPIWLVAVYFVMTLSELCISPIGLSLVSKLAPPKFLSFMMGCWFFTCFIGDTIAGFWGGKYGSVTAVQLFVPLAIMSFVTFVIILLLLPKLKKVLYI